MGVGFRCLFYRDLTLASLRSCKSPCHHWVAGVLQTSVPCWGSWAFLWNSAICPTPKLTRLYRHTYPWTPHLNHGVRSMCFVQLVLEWIQGGDSPGACQGLWSSCQFLSLLWKHHLQGSCAGYQAEDLLLSSAGIGNKQEGLWSWGCSL